MNTEATLRGLEIFTAGYCCAETVLMTMAERLGIQSPLIPRIASGFCGGIARTGHLCGAVTGGVMALNLASGRDALGESRERNRQLLQAFMSRFETRFGSLDCRELSGYDLTSEEGLEAFYAQDVLEYCRKYPLGSIELVTELLENRGEA